MILCIHEAIIMPKVVLFFREAHIYVVKLLLFVVPRMQNNESKNNLDFSYIYSQHEKVTQGGAIVSYFLPDFDFQVASPSASKAKKASRNAHLYSFSIVVS